MSKKVKYELAVKVPVDESLIEVDDTQMQDQEQLSAFWSNVIMTYMSYIKEYDNYVEFQFNDTDNDDLYVVTICKSKQDTPHSIRKSFERELKVWEGIMLDALIKSQVESRDLKYMMHKFREILVKYETF